MGAICVTANNHLEPPSMLNVGGVKAMDEQYAYMVEELELPEDILDELLGDFCISSTDHIDQIQPVANCSVSDFQFEDISKRLHTLTGSTALLAFREMSGVIDELHKAMRKASEESGVSGVSAMPFALSPLSTLGPYCWFNFRCA